MTTKSKTVNAAAEVADETSPIANPAAEIADEGPPQRPRLEPSIKFLTVLLNEFNGKDQDIKNHEALALRARADLDAVALSGDLDDLGKVGKLCARKLQAELSERHVELHSNQRNEAEEKLKAQNGIAWRAVARALRIIHKAYVDKTAEELQQNYEFGSLSEAREKALSAKIPSQAQKRCTSFDWLKHQVFSPTALAAEIIGYARGAQTELRELDITGY